MILSLVRILAFIGLIVGLALGIVWLRNYDTTLHIATSKYEITLTPIMGIVSFGALILIIWLFIKCLGFVGAVIRFINGDETAISRYFAKARDRRGYDVLSSGLISMASGDSDIALSKIEQAAKYLNKPELTTLLTAQAAQQAGNRQKARDAYKTLLQYDRTRFVGIQGLMKRSLVDGKRDLAQKLAEKALLLKPKHEETQNTLLKLQAIDKNWQGVRATLGLKLKTGYLPRAVHKRRDGVIALQEALDLQEAGNGPAAIDRAIEANRLSPTLVPAAVMAARAYSARGKVRKARNIIKTAWQDTAHPALVGAFYDLAPDETMQERLKRFNVLKNLAPDDPQTHIELAKLHISTGDFTAAKDTLTPLIDTAPTTGVMTLMADIERHLSGDQTNIQAWLERAILAPRDRAWVCDNCGHNHTDWRAICTRCHAVDTLTWQCAHGQDQDISAQQEQIEQQIDLPSAHAELTFVTDDK